jgi:Kelch motif
MRAMIRHLLALTLGIGSSLNAQAPALPGLWKMGVYTNSQTSRHECSFVGAGNKFLLMGGREFNFVEAYDIGTNTWAKKPSVPKKDGKEVLIHHFQATNYGNIITIVGASTGYCCAEPGLPNIYYYDPIDDIWVLGMAVPAARLRGTSGVVVYQDKFYQISGNTKGHESGNVKWTDSWDPLTNKWAILPDAPHARDHFHAALHGGKIYAGGGRRSQNDKPIGIFKDTEASVDVFDIATSTWSTIADPMPTQRGAPQTAVLGNEIFYYGGEGGPDNQPETTKGLHPQCEALNVMTGKWKRYSNTPAPRHGTQVIVNNGGLYAAAGAASQGGDPNEIKNNIIAFYPGGIETKPTTEEITKGALKNSDVVAYRKVGTPIDTIFIPIVHSSGNQGVLISSITLKNAAKAKIADSLIFPMLLAPGRTYSLVMTATNSSAFAGDTIVIKTAIPAGLTFTIPFTTSTTVSINPVLTKSKVGKGHDPVLENIQGKIQIRTIENGSINDPKLFNLSGQVLKP